MKNPQRFVAVLALTLGACGSGHDEDNAAAPVAAPVPAATPAKSLAKNLEIPTAEIGVPGAKSETLADGRTVICGADSRDCVCLEPAPCADDGSCPQLASTLAALREALARKGDGAVSCGHAELGRCGEYSYLDFNGDNQRHEVRWFDATGRQTGIREWTDYTAWCGGKARARFVGHVPRCDTPVRDELLCGDATASTANPLEDLRNRIRARPAEAEPAR